MRLLGLDPGLRITGWGIIEAKGQHLRHVANGKIVSDANFGISERLVQLHDGIMQVLKDYKPEEAAVEETFVNSNPSSTLALGLARGMALLAPAQCGLSVSQYLPNKVKKSVVGAGHADKKQVQMMVERLLPGVTFACADAADALAVAICHAHLRTTAAKWEVHDNKGQANQGLSTLGGYKVYQRERR